MTEEVNRFEHLLQDLEDYRNGKTRWKTTIIAKDGTRTVLWETYAEALERRKSLITQNPSPLSEE